MCFVQYESKIIPKFRINTTNSKTFLKNFKIKLLITFYKATEIEYWYAIPSERNGVNVLGLVMFCLTFGYVISQMGNNGKILLDFFESLNEASTKLIGIAML